MRTRVINLVGASGSGKDRVAKELVKRGYHDIPSYTTRKPREKDEWGHIFLEQDWEAIYVNGNFVGIENHELEEYIDIDHMIAYFNSYRSGNHYFATDDQVLRGKTNIYRVDPAGAEMVKDYYKGTDVEVITIFLQADWIERRGRLMSRGDTYRKAMERLRKDESVFGVAKCDYTVNANARIDKVVERVVKILEG